MRMEGGNARTGRRTGTSKKKRINGRGKRKKASQGGGQEKNLRLGRNFFGEKIPGMGKVNDNGDQKPIPERQTKKNGVNKSFRGKKGHLSEPKLHKREEQVENPEYPKLRFVRGEAEGTKGGGGKLVVRPGGPRTHPTEVFGGFPSKNTQKGNS